MEEIHGIKIHEDTSGPRPIRVRGTSILGLIGEANGADAKYWPANTPVLVSQHPDSFTEERKLDPATNLYKALKTIFDEQPTYVVVIRMEGEVDAAKTVKLFERSESITGKIPKILCTNGYTASLVSDAVDPVLQAFTATAKKIRAIVVTDVAVSSESFDYSDFDQYEPELEKYLKANKHHRIYPAFGKVRIQVGKTQVPVPASLLVCALIVKNDSERRWSQSPSNMRAESIHGVEHPVSFSLTDPKSEANRLNKLGVACIIKYEGAFKLWGNKGLGCLEEDKRYQFINIIRTYDIMIDSLLSSHMWAMDLGISPTYMEDVSTSQNIFYSQLKRDGHLVKAECIPGTERTSEEQILSGNVYWTIKWCGIYPANTLNFDVIMETAYLKDFMEGASE